MIARSPPTIRTNCPGNCVLIQLRTYPMNGAESTSAADAAIAIAILREVAEATEPWRAAGRVGGAMGYDYGIMRQRAFVRMSAALVLAVATAAAAHTVATQGDGNAPRIEISFTGA